MKERIDRINKILATNPAWYGTLPLPENSSEFSVITWEKALNIYQAPIVPEFIPTFRRATGTDGQISWPLESDYFATAETAAEMASRYGDPGTSYVEVPFGGSGGLFAASANEYHIQVNGTLKNAGLLAAFYKRNPERDFPGLADKLIRAALGL